MNNTVDLSLYGIADAVQIIRNPSYEQLFAEETRIDLVGYERGVVTDLGAVNVMTGKFTGRCPKDKYIVMDDVSRDTVWWTSERYPNDNKPIDENVWNALKTTAARALSGKRLFVVDAFCGANERTRLKVRFIMEVAWQAHFVTNMFIRPTEQELTEFGEPDFVVLTASKACVEGHEALGLNSPTAVVFNLKEKMQVILNTWYGGEMKKGLFSVMNWLNPLRGIASMHCSANTNQDGTNTAIFFGLSGTGKTTLSADPKRLLIGDDEHGWDEDGVFNYEGGCYAKVVDLDPVHEPDIYNAIRRNALLENVVVDEQGRCHFSDTSATPNTRVSYPIDHIDAIVKPISRGPHAKEIVFLTFDAYGVLPPVSILTDEQAEYYFLSGYTSKVAGTELGVDDPVPTFSACFGGAFLSLHPLHYAQDLVRKTRANNAKVYLVNTGMTGTGRRMPLRQTRAIIDAIFDGSILKAPTATVPHFNLVVPTSLAGVDETLLDPRRCYADTAMWDAKARRLARAFQANFEKFTDDPDCARLAQSGPQESARVAG